MRADQTGMLLLGNSCQKAFVELSRSLADKIQSSFRTLLSI